MFFIAQKLTFLGLETKVLEGNYGERNELLLTVAIELNPKATPEKKMGWKRKDVKAIQWFFLESKRAFDTTHIATIHVSVCVCADVSRYSSASKMIAVIRFIRHRVSPATVTYPSPPTLVIFRRKSTEFRLGGFHLRMSSHLPGLYLCRDTKSQNINNNTEDLLGINTY